MTRIALSLALILVACGGDLSDAQLEAAEIRDDSADASEEAARTVLAGALSVEGSGRDWTLALPGEAGPVTVEVHSPAGTDLSALAGQPVTLTLLRSWTGRASSLAMDDAEGLVWAIWGPSGNAVVKERFGADFVRWGESLGHSRADGMARTWRTLSFATDAGRVEVGPGEVETLTLGGASFKVTVIAAYEEEPLPRTAVADCGGGGDLMSFEIERVDAPVSDLRERPAGQGMAARSCGD